MADLESFDADIFDSAIEGNLKDAEGKNRHPHIINGSGTALARLFVALIETYQQPDGGILIPEPLQKYIRTDRIPAN